jgi:hypothetical protein
MNPKEKINKKTTQQRKKEEKRKEEFSGKNIYLSRTFFNISAISLSFLIYLFAIPTNNLNCQPPFFIQLFFTIQQFKSSRNQ